MTSLILEIILSVNVIYLDNKQAKRYNYTQLSYLNLKFKKMVSIRLASGWLCRLLEIHIDGILFQN